MKWVLILASLLAAGLAVSWWWAGKDLKPLTVEAQASAPGAFVEVSAGRLHYHSGGPEDGPVIVMVHGFSTPNFIFEQNAAALKAAGFRVIQFDHFGRGWSDRPKGPYDTEFYDRELLEFLDGLSLPGPVGLVGLSMGGPIVAEFAARHPERVSRVFLLVPAGLDVAGTDGTQASLIQAPVIGDWLWRMVAMKSITGDPQYDETGLEPQNRLQGDVRAQMAYSGYGQALLSTFRHFPLSGREATYSALSETGIPVAAVFGTSDPTVLIASANQFSALVPEAEVHVLEGADHGLNYKRHTDVNPLLAGWFAPELPVAEGP